MNAYTHMVVGGLTAGIIPVSAFLKTSEPTLATAASLGTLVYSSIGGIAADVDMPRTKAGKKFRNLLLKIMAMSTMIITVATILSFRFGLKVPPLLFITPLVTVGIWIIINNLHHRRETHNIWISAILGVPLIFALAFDKTLISYYLYLGFWLGYCSHVVIDLFNGKGEPLLWPISKERYSLAKVHAGTHEEDIFRRCSYIFFIVVYCVIFMRG